MSIYNTIIVPQKIPHGWLSRWWHSAQALWRRSPIITALITLLPTAIGALLPNFYNSLLLLLIPSIAFSLILLRTVDRSKSQHLWARATQILFHTLPKLKILLHDLIILLLSLYLFTLLIDIYFHPAAQFLTNTQITTFNWQTYFSFHFSRHNWLTVTFDRLHNNIYYLWLPVVLFPLYLTLSTNNSLEQNLILIWRGIKLTPQIFLLFMLIGFLFPNVIIPWLVAQLVPACGLTAALCSGFILYLVGNLCILTFSYFWSQEMFTEADSLVTNY